MSIRKISLSSSMHTPPTSKYSHQVAILCPSNYTKMHIIASDFSKIFRGSMPPDPLQGLGLRPSFYRLYASWLVPRNIPGIRLCPMTGGRGCIQFTKRNEFFLLQIRKQSRTHQCWELESWHPQEMQLVLFCCHGTTGTGSIISTVQFVRQFSPLCLHFTSTLSRSDAQWLSGFACAFRTPDSHV